MKTVKKVIGIAIPALSMLAFAWVAAVGVLYLVNGLSIIRGLYAVPPIVVAVIGFFKGLSLLLRSFKTNEYDYSHRKDCVKYLRTVAMYFIITAIFDAITSFFTLATAARSGKPSDTAIANMLTTVIIAIIVIILGIISRIVSRIGQGKRADDQPVRKVAVLISVLFLIGCIISSCSSVYTLVPTLVEWLFIIVAVAVVAYAFIKPEVQVALEDTTTENVEATQQDTVSEEKTEQAE